MCKYSELIHSNPHEIDTLFIFYTYCDIVYFHSICMENNNYFLSINHMNVIISSLLTIHDEVHNIPHVDQTKHIVINAENRLL